MCCSISPFIIKSPEYLFVKKADLTYALILIESVTDFISNSIVNLLSSSSFLFTVTELLFTLTPRSAIFAELFNVRTTFKVPSSPTCSLLFSK